MNTKRLMYVARRIERLEKQLAALKIASRELESAKVFHSGREAEKAARAMRKRPTARKEEDD